MQFKLIPPIRHELGPSNIFMRGIMILVMIVDCWLIDVGASSSRSCNSCQLWEVPSITQVFQFGAIGLWLNLNWT